MRYGAIINGILIITGGLLGLLFGRFIKERVKDTVLKGIGVSVMLMGVAGTLSKMFLVTDGAVGTQGSVMLVVCLAAGAVIGELLDIDGGMERFGRWLKIKTGNAREGGFVDAFVTTTLIVGVGAMAIMGSITDGLTGDPTILVIKSIIDLITVAFLSSAMGKGCLFSFIPVLVFEGAITVLAGFLSPVMTDAALSALSLVGNSMMCMIGINLFRPGTFRAGNYLPALVFAVVWALLELPMT